MDEIKDRLKQAVETPAPRPMKPGAPRRRIIPPAKRCRTRFMNCAKWPARLEIELAVADRQQNPNDPIPIPAHRAAGRGRGAQQGPADDIGNPVGGSDEGSRPVRARRPPRPRSDDGEGGSKPLSLKRSSEE